MPTEPTPFVREHAGGQLMSLHLVAQGGRLSTAETCELLNLAERCLVAYDAARAEAEALRAENDQLASDLAVACEMGNEDLAVDAILTAANIPGRDGETVLGLRERVARLVKERDDLDCCFDLNQIELETWRGNSQHFADTIMERDALRTRCAELERQAAEARRSYQSARLSEQWALDAEDRYRVVNEQLATLRAVVELFIDYCEAPTLGGDAFYQFRPALRELCDKARAALAAQPGTEGE